MENNKKGFWDSPLPPELTPERCEVDGHILFRFTFLQSSPDFSEEFYQFVSLQLSRMGYQHITIHCPEGYPVWLTKLLRHFQGYGLPVEVTPTPSDAELLAAIESAIGGRYDPLKWPSD